MAMMTFSSAALAQSSQTAIPTPLPTLTVPTEGVQEIGSVTHLRSLAIGQGARLTAPPGYTLTLVVNNVETDIAPGTYKGDVVLVPTQDVTIRFTDMGANQTNAFRSAVYIDNGVYVASKSVPQVAGSPGADKLSNDFAKGVSIASHGKEFNGIIVTGNSRFSISNLSVNEIGNGRNDFDGLGSAIKVDGRSNVTIDHARIRNKGVTRTAIWVGDHATATINDSDIEVADGTLPADYSWSWLNPAQSKDVMLETPWMLGIRGNNRATLVVDSGTVHYNRTHIRAEAWGALSTDDPKGEIQLTATDCRIETTRSGYGAYSVGNTLDTFSHTRFDVADYGAILASGSAVFTDASVVNSRRIGVLAHGGASGSLTIDKGSVFNTAKAVIQLKSSSPDILVDGARLHSKSGVILEAFVNDDPDNGGSGPPPPPSGASGDSSPPPPQVSTGRYNAPHATKDIEARFANVNLTGDFINALTSQSNLNLHLLHARIRGAITTATATHATGPRGEKLVMQDAPDLYYLIGEMIETYAPSADAHGVQLDLDATSRWEVTKTSYLNSLTLAPGSQVTAPKGAYLKFTVNGIATPLEPGHYRGQLTLKPAR